MKKKGFTLVELLGVIVVLAVIALIAVPQIVSIVDKSKKGAFKDSAIGLLEAAEMYYAADAGRIISVNLADETLPSKLNFKGTPPLGGWFGMDQDGKTAIIMYNQKYCAYKWLTEKEVDVIDIKSVEECNISLFGDNITSPFTNIVIN